jgi:hypothetical protein
MKSGSAGPPTRPTSAIQAVRVWVRQDRPPSAPSTRARAGASSQSGRVLQHRLEPFPERHQGAQQPLERRGGGGGGCDEGAVRLGQLGLDAEAGLLRGGAGVDVAAHGEQQGFERAARYGFGDALQPSIARQFGRGEGGSIDRVGARSS